MKYTIYKCYCEDASITDFYVGSTIDLQQRIQSHKKHYKQNQHSKLYNFIRENGGFSKWEFEPLEEDTAEDKTHIRIREQHYIDKLTPTLNQVKAYITKEQRRLYLNEQRAKYRERHPEKIKEWNDKISKMKWRCETCNHNYPYSVKARHLKTKKHIDNINGVERRPRTNIREDTGRCDQTTQTPQKKSFTEQEYLEVLQNPNNYNQFFEFCGECGT